MKKCYLLIICAATVQNGLCGYAPVNLLYPQDTVLKPRKWSDQRLHISHSVLFGVSDAQGWNGNGDKVSATQVWTADQNALAMVTGFDQGTEQANIAQECNAVDGDDGVRGHFDVTGDFNIPFSYQFGARYYIKNAFWVGAFIPVYKMQFKNVAWTDHTLNITADDVLTKARITTDFFANVSRLGDGLNLQEWEKTGFGDVVLMAGWHEHFRQYKEWIKDVATNVRVGISLPTGVQKDEDKVMFMPFGNDGSVAILAGMGLTINYVNRFNAGVDLEFLHVFNNTRKRRIKVDADQTEFLLLTKTDVQKDPGFSHRFMLFCDAKLVKGLSARVAYHHRKRSADTLYVLSYDYSSTIANTAESLKEWTTHNALFQLTWDMADEEKNKNKPQFTAFYMHPFNGRRSVQSAQAGCGFSLSF